MATKNAYTVSKVAFGEVEIDSYLTTRKPSGVGGGEVIKFPDNWKKITGERVSDENKPVRKLDWGFKERQSDQD